MVRLKDLTDWERMVADYGLLGLSPSYHPLALLRKRLPNDLATAARLRTMRDGARVRTTGLVVCRQRPGTAKGFVFLLLEDETGLLNVVVHPDLYDAARSVIRGEPYLWVEGRVQLRSGALNLIAGRVGPLARLPGALRPHSRLDGPGSDPSQAHDPHAMTLGPSAEPAGPTSSPLRSALRLATPAGRDFH